LDDLSLSSPSAASPPEVDHQCSDYLSVSQPLDDAVDGNSADPDRQCSDYL